MKSSRFPLSSHSSRPASRESRRGLRRQKLEQLELRTLMDGDPNANPWHNYAIAADVNQDGLANSVDINLLGNQLASRGEGALPAAGPGQGGMLLDVNNDFLLTQEDLDAAMQGILGGGGAQGEGENVNVRLQFVNASTNAPITSVNFGSDFKLRVFITDTRTSGPSFGEYGIYSFFTDVTYGANIVGYKGPFNTAQIGSDTTTGQYDFLPYVDGSTPGLLDEAGGNYTDLVFPVGGLGHTEYLLFEATFHAGAQPDAFTVAEDSGATIFSVLPNDNVAGSTTFSTNMADNSVLLFWDPSSDIVQSDITFGSASITHANNAVTNNANYTITAVSTGSAGGQLLRVNGNKQIQYTPAANFFGTETFTYTISDGAGHTDTGTVTVTVTGVNDEPVVVTDNRATDENTPITFTVASILSNDTAGPANETASQTVSFVSVAATSANGGTVVYNSGTGEITYTPVTGFTGTDTINYTITDNGTTNGFPDAKTKTGIISVFVGEVNSPPFADNDTATATEDVALTILRTSLIANDNAGPSEGSQTLTITNVTNTTPGGAGGTVTINGAGNVVYTPAANFNGTYTFTYTITDNGTTNGIADPKSATATVTVTVNAVNDAPVPTNDTRTTAEDTPLAIVAATLAANDAKGPATATDEAPQTLTVTGVSATSSQGGTVTLVSGNITYTPPSNFVGTDTFTYTVTDNGVPAQSATGTVNVTVTEVNDAPTANTDTIASSNEDTQVTIAHTTLLNNDTKGAPNESTQILTITGVSATSAQGGTVLISGSNILYTPPANYFGPDSFTYTITDNGTTNGAANPRTATGTVNLNILAVNDPPTAANKTATTPEDTAVTITQATLIAGGTTGPANENTQALRTTAVSATSANGGTVTRNSTTGDVTYTPAANFNGTDTFTVTISDDGTPNATTTQTVTVTVTEVNDDPTAVANNLGSSAEDVVVIIPIATLLGNDTKGPANESGQTISITGVSATSANGGTVVINGSNVEYTPPANYAGSDSFTYTITDNGTTNGVADPKTATGTVSLTLTAVNDPPIAGIHNLTTAEDTALNVTTASLIAVDSPGPANESSQTKAFVAGPATSAQGGTVAVTGSGSSQSVRYTPPANFVGTDTFTYTVRDNGSPQQSTVVTVTVVVSEVNDAPTAVADTGFSTNEDVAATINAADLITNDSKGPANESGQTLTVTNVSTSLAGATVSLVAGVITFTPPADFNGNATFSYTITDNGTTNGSADPKTSTATVTVVVNPVNDAPVAGGDTRTTNEDTALTFAASQLLTNDTKGPANENSQTISVTGVSATSANGGTVTLVSGNITYTPAANFNGTDTFTYTITDNGSPAQQATGTVTVTVVQQNDAPTAVADDFTADVDTPLLIPVADVLVNDLKGPSPSEDGQTLTVISVGTAAHGTVTLSAGVITYTPNTGYEGPDSFTYTIRDNGTNGSTAANLQATGTVNIDVFSGTPNARNDAYSIGEDASATLFNVQSNDSISDGGTAAITAVTQGNHGGLVEIVGSQIRYTPAANYNGPETFTYTLEDGIGEPDTATVTMTVTEVNDDPVANNDSGNAAEDTATTFNLSTLIANDNRGATNESSQTLTITGFSATSAMGGTVALVSGNLVYTPPANYVGPDSFTYSVTDNGTTNGAANPRPSNTATVNVTVTAVNDAPTGGGDSASTVEDTATTIVASTLTTNDSPGPANESTQSLTVTGVSATSANGGTVNLVAGVITYTPAANFNGTDTFTYTVRDNGQTNGSDDFKTTTVTVTVSVSEVNDGPTAANKTASTTEDAPLTITLATLVTGASKGPANESSQTLAVNSVSPVGSAGGTIAIVSGNIVYTPAADFSGTETFTYTLIDNGTTNGVADGQVSNTATITVTVANTNDAPIAATDTILVDEGTAKTFTVASLMGNDNPGSGESFQTITFVGIGTSTSTNFTLNTAHGKVRRQGNNLTYTPNAGYTGPDSFTYRIKDNGSPSITSTGTVNITVGEINDAPNAANDTVTVNEDTAIAISALANDNAGPNESSQTLTVTDFDATTAQGGTVTYNAGTKQFTYTPPSDYFGPDSFTYELTDNGTTNGSPDPKSDLATVNITVNSVNDAPVAGVDSAVTTENQFILIPIATLLSNDTKGAANESSQTLTITAVSPNSANGGTVQIVGTNVKYTPPLDYQGSDSFTYTVRDNGTPNASSTGTVNIGIGELNTPPVGGTDSASTPEDTLLNLLASNLLANDSPGPADESGQSLTVTGFSATSAQGGTVTFNGTTFAYTPPSNYVGPDSFTYTITDNGTTVGSPDPKSANVTVNVNVTAVNDAPDAQDDTVQAVKGVNNQTLVVLTNDTKGPANESSQTLTIISVSPGSAGGTLTINANGTLNYTPPNATFTGSETFTYTIRDNGQTNGGNDFKTDTATVTVNVVDFLPFSISGKVYFELNGNHTKDANERAIGGVTITVTGTTFFGTPVSLPPQKTLADGTYLFENLIPGTYQIVETQPALLPDGQDTSLTPGLVQPSTSADRFTITTGPLDGTHAVANFGEGSARVSVLRSNVLPLASGAAPGTVNGIEFGVQNNGNQHYFSLYNGWSITKTASLTLSADRRTAVLTLVDLSDVTHVRNLTAASGQFTVIGTNNAGSYQVRLNGTAASYGITLGALPEGDDDDSPAAPRSGGLIHGLTTSLVNILDSLFAKYVRRQ